MIYEISNNNFTAKIDSLGAQLISLQGKDGFEYIWTGDPKHWREHAPVLFPIVGALREGKIRIAGQWFEMGRHGFAKQTEFAWENQTSASISLVLAASPETRSMYPYDFKLTVRYRLESKGIVTEFKVENCGSSQLIYAIGGHPGFNIPVNESANFEDYTIVFDSPESQTCPVIDRQAGLIDWDQQGFVLNGQEIPLKHELFYQDALVFENLNSHWVRVLNKNTGKGIAMDFEEFPMFGIWSAANDGPYVCLEPWTGCATLVSEGDEFEEKKGMIILAPGASRAHSFSVEVL